MHEPHAGYVERCRVQPAGLAWNAVPSAGRADFVTVGRRRRAVGTRSGALEEQLALAGVARKRCRALKLRAGPVEASELGEVVAAHRRQDDYRQTSLSISASRSATAAGSLICRTAMVALPMRVNPTSTAPS